MANLRAASRQPGASVCTKTQRQADIKELLKLSGFDVGDFGSVGFAFLSIHALQDLDTCYACRSCGVLAAGHLLVLFDAAHEITKLVGYRARNLKLEDQRVSSVARSGQCDTAEPSVTNDALHFSSDASDFARIGIIPIVSFLGWDCLRVEVLCAWRGATCRDPVRALHFCVSCAGADLRIALHAIQSQERETSIQLDLLVPGEWVPDEPRRSPDK